jgi:peptidoglycan/xylan/chitin deacetylase (PgdA/CDA1 family)
MKFVVLHVAKALGLFALSRWITRRGLRVLCYHGIWMGEGHFGNHLFMSPEKFAARVAYLARSGYPILSLDDAVARLETWTLPNCATVITIDDGWHGTYRHMLPALEANELAATIYVTTYFAERQQPVFDLLVRYMIETTNVRALDLATLGLSETPSVPIDTDVSRARAVQMILDYEQRYLDVDGRDIFASRLGAILDIDFESLVENKVFHLMSLEEVADAANRGHDIQLHTHRHKVPLDDLPGVAQEISENRSLLEPITQSPLRHFCYPNGFCEKSVWPGLETLDIASATTVEQGLNYARSPRLGLKRLLDGQDVSQIRFEAELSGLIELSHRFRKLYDRIASQLNERPAVRAKRHDQSTQSPFDRGSETQLHEGGATLSRPEKERLVSADSDPYRSTL